LAQRLKNGKRPSSKTTTYPTCHYGRRTYGPHAPGGGRSDDWTVGESTSLPSKGRFNVSGTASRLTLCRLNAYRIRIAASLGSAQLADGTRPANPCEAPPRGTS
jgi:hypothetical protein